MQLRELQQKCIASSKYPLMPGATQLVPGYGNAHADIMLIGEAPGASEDANGIPFVGRAGKILDELLDSIGLIRSDIYISNMVKCRPPQNRDPTDSEILLYKPWLDWEIKLIQPKVIVPLGRFAMSKFIPGKKISKVHGQVFVKGSRTFFLMYHPAIALYNPSKKEVLLEDFAKLKLLLLGKGGEHTEVEDSPVSNLAEITELLTKTETTSSTEGSLDIEQVGLF